MFNTNTLRKCISTFFYIVFQCNIECNFHFPSGEMSHHDVLDAVHSNVSVILCNHSNSERGYLFEFKETLARLLDDNSIEISLSETDADPLVTH